ncbi:ABC transporter ATP-binding protein [Aestuariibacter halophilus]|uniref:ABC transporter ATP-binding protein n=1 Tax=Fluctibacter halophilus TaxID=226011 RepID=A0ABS8G6I3_9ALTE|nr:ABC transporter ATP-binding protein [Aestuariibacter halophilus]MCC2616133.1 ABC transporter ATP-binding protein [Aestuariibacter halophilus]
MGFDITRALPLVQLQHIDKVYDNGEIAQKVLDDLSLTVYQGEYVSMVGPSGSGKSTLMNLIGCLDRASGGAYRFKGTDVYQAYSQEQLSDMRLRFIGFIFQNYSLFPKLSALENVMTPLMYNQTPRGARKAIAMEALERVGLGDKARNLPCQLSGGQQQRVAIARALVKKPELILADEPTGNLDSENSAMILELFEQLHKDGNSLIVITHEDQVARHSQRMITLQDGRVV